MKKIFKKRLFIVFVCIAAVASISVICAFAESDKIVNTSENRFVVGEYEDVGKWSDSIVCDQSVEAYKIGANKAGMPIYCSPEKAFEQMKIDLADAIEYIQLKMEKMPPLDGNTVCFYSIYSWQLWPYDNAEIQQKCMEVGGFFDIYENSFDDDYFYENVWGHDQYPPIEDV